MLNFGTWHSLGVLVTVLFTTLISERSQAPTKKSSQLAVKWGEADVREARWGEADVREARKTTDKHFMAAVIWNN